VKEQEKLRADLEEARAIASALRSENECLQKERALMEDHYAYNSKAESEKAHRDLNEKQNRITELMREVCNLKNEKLSLSTELESLRG